MQSTEKEPAAHQSAEAFLSEPQDYSLVLGGPLFQLYRKARLTGDALELLHRRMILSVLITWLPLLILAAFGRSAESAGRISFFQDVEVHTRFLVALPVLIFAEVVVHSRIRIAVHRFIDLRMVLPEEFSRFYKAIHSAIKIRNSTVAETALVFLVYTAGLWLWNSRVVPSYATWYSLPGERWKLTPAGYWYVFVSIPVFQFILLRWYMRLFIWFRFLWQVNRIKLNLFPSHPDRCGGLSFLGRSSYAFGPILFAQGAILAGLVTDRVLYGHESLISFKFQIVGFIVFFVVAILGPLLMFTPRMARTRRQGLAEYAVLAQRYVENFDRKWIREPSSSEEMLGTGDIQSLADLGNSCDIVREMRVVPFGLQDISRLALATAAPLTPLLLTIFSPEELILRVIKVIF